MIAIISDVHGNYPALQAVLQEIEEVNCKQIISLGDVAGYYCKVNECIELMRERNVTHLMGNHDFYLINNVSSGKSKSVDRCIQYQNKIIKQENIKWLEKCKPSLQLENISMVHGGWNDNLEEYIYSISSSYFDNYDYEYFFCGHSHVQKYVEFKNKIFCNPGSVGQPRDGDWRASFALLHEDGRVELKRSEYDVNEIAEAMKNADFEPYFYENLFMGTRLGGEISKINVTEGDL